MVGVRSGTSVRPWQERNDERAVVEEEDGEGLANRIDAIKSVSPISCKRERTMMCGAVVVHVLLQPVQPVTPSVQKKNPLLPASTAAALLPASTVHVKRMIVTGFLA